MTEKQKFSEMKFSVLDAGNKLCYNIEYEPSEVKRNFLPIEGNSKSLSTVKQEGKSCYLAHQPAFITQPPSSVPRKQRTTIPLCPLAQSPHQCRRSGIMGWKSADNCAVSSEPPNPPRNRGFFITQKQAKPRFDRIKLMNYNNVSKEITRNQQECRGVNRNT